MSYYHEARAQVKALKSITESNKRKAERRAELAGVEVEQPFDLLRLDGRSCKLFRNNDLREQVESMEGFLPWNGNTDNLIDRFDGRAMLDFYRDYDPRRARPTSADDEEIDQLLVFEAFRDLVKIAGQSEAVGLAIAQEENLELRATARAAANEKAGANLPRPLATTSTPAGFGSYGAVGFSYGGEQQDVQQVSAPGFAPPPRAASDESDGSAASDSDLDSDDEANELAQEDVSAIAGAFGIAHFEVMLRRALRQEAEEADGRVPKPKRAMSRKKAAQRAKRMAGQGHGALPSNGPLWESRDQKPPRLPGATYAYRSSRRGSPSYDEEYARSRRSRSRSESPARDEGPRTTYITSFSNEPEPAERRGTGAQAATGGIGKTPPWLKPKPTPPWLAETRGDPGPGTLTGFRRADPPPEADTGPVQLPAEGNVVRGVSADDYWAKQREAERQSRYEERQRAREKEKKEERRKQVAEPAPKPAVAKPGKETPQERLKRLMAAQINKQVAKDTRTVAQKKAAQDRDAAARQQIERAAYAMDKHRSRSPSPRYRRRSRSRSPRRSSHSRRDRSWSPDGYNQRRGSESPTRRR